MSSHLPEVQLTISELERTFGVLFVGYVVAMVAYGFTFFQTYVYYSRFPLDHWGVKATVGAICLLDTTTSALISHALYHYLVLLFPYTTGLVEATSTFCAEIGLSVLAIYIVQIFYAVRIGAVSKNYTVSGLIMTLSTAAFALGIAMTAKMIEDNSFSRLTVFYIKGIVSAGQSITFACGLLIFCCLCYYLNPSQNSSIKPIQGWYNKMVTFTMSRCLLATVVQFGFFITFITMPSKVIWMPFHLVSSKIFVNSLLTMLNSRDEVCGRGIYEEDSTSRTANSPSFLNADVRGNSNIRFEAVNSKPAISLNIEVSRSVEHETTASKIVYDETSPWRPSDKE